MSAENGDAGSVIKRIAQTARSDGVFVSGGLLLSVLAFICAGLSGFIATQVVEQGKQLAIILDSRETNLRRLTTIEATVSEHSLKLNDAINQEHNDTVMLQQQIQQSSQKLEQIQAQLDAMKAQIEALPAHPVPRKSP